MVSVTNSGVKGAAFGSSHHTNDFSICLPPKFQLTRKFKSLCLHMVPEKRTAHFLPRPVDYPNLESMTNFPRHFSREPTHFPPVSFSECHTELRLATRSVSKQSIKGANHIPPPRRCFRPIRPSYVTTGSLFSAQATSTCPN